MLKHFIGDCLLIFSPITAVKHSTYPDLNNISKLSKVIVNEFSHSVNSQESAKFLFR